MHNLSLAAAHLRSVQGTGSLLSFEQQPYAMSDVKFEAM